MIRPVVRAMVVVGTFVVAASGCSGGGSATPSTTVEVTVAPPTSEVTTTTPSTSAPETSTSTVPPATTEPTVPTTEPTVPSTSDPTSTTTPDGVPPRVTFPDDPDLQAVVDAYARFSDANRAALEDPGNQAKVDALLATTTGSLRERVERVVADLAAAGEAYVTNPEQPSYTEILPLTVFVIDDVTAAFDGCSVDTDLHVIVGAGPNGEDQVLDEAISSSLLNYTLTKVNGEWLLSSIALDQTFEGQIGCE